MEVGILVSCSTSPVIEQVLISFPAETSSQASLLTEQIRSGGLRSMLELGVTPSHVSIAVDDSAGEGVLVRNEEGGEEEEEEVEREGYCIPLESLGLGGNQISDAGAASLAVGLAKNTSK